MKKFIKVFLFTVSGALLAVVLAYIRFQQTVNREIKDLFKNARKEDKIMITADMLDGLPDPVRRYLLYSEIVGKTLVRTVHIKQVGKFRTGVEQPWMDMVADQYYTVDPPGFIWNATLKIGGLPILRVRDRYAGGQGNMQAKLAAIYPLFNESGDKLSQAAMVRYLSEMIWFPASFLGKNILWKAIDDHSAEVALTDLGKTVSAKMVFDDEGRLVYLIAKRYNQQTDSFEDWETPIDEYGELAGLRLGVRGRAIWHLETGDLPYIDVTLTEVEYNRPV